MTSGLEYWRSSGPPDGQNVSDAMTWVWRLIGDQPTGSEGDIADFFASGQAGPVAGLSSDRGRIELDLAGDSAGEVDDE